MSSSELTTCACGCGAVWRRRTDRRSVSPYAPQCTKNPKAIERARRHPRPLIPCICGKCGLTFEARFRRQYAEDCPTRQAMTLAYQAEQYAAARARRREARGLPPDDAPRPPKPGKRCTACEGMPHRRPLGGCVCGQPYAAEEPPRAQAVLASSAGIVLRW